MALLQGQSNVARSAITSRQKMRIIIGRHFTNPLSVFIISRTKRPASQCVGGAAAAWLARAPAPQLHHTFAAASPCSAFTPRCSVEPKPGAGGQDGQQEQERAKFVCMLELVQRDNPSGSLAPGGGTMPVASGVTRRVLYDSTGRSGTRTCSIRLFRLAISDFSLTISGWMLFGSPAGVAELRRSLTPPRSTHRHNHRHQDQLADREAEHRRLVFG